MAVEFKTDIKIFSASRKTEIDSEGSRIARLETVVEFLLEYGNVGMVDKPNGYIEDTLPMRWGSYASTGEDTVIYFGGETPTTAIGLVGSINHVIGNVGTDSPSVGSLTSFIIKTRRRAEYQRACDSSLAPQSARLPYLAFCGSQARKSKHDGPAPTLRVHGEEVAGFGKRS